VTATPRVSRPRCPRRGSEAARRKRLVRFRADAGRLISTALKGLATRLYSEAFEMAPLADDAPLRTEHRYLAASSAARAESPGGPRNHCSRHVRLTCERASVQARGKRKAGPAWCWPCR
jgi:hypothetical protein